MPVAADLLTVICNVQRTCNSFIFAFFRTSNNSQLFSFHHIHAMGWGSDKTQKRALERARKTLRDAGELPPVKQRKRDNAGWGRKSQPHDDSWGKSSSSTSSSWQPALNSTWNDDKHWADTPAPPAGPPATVPPPPPPVRDVKVEPETLDEVKLDVPDFEIYSFGRKDGSAQPPVELNLTIDCEIFRSASSDRESWACCGLNGAVLLEIATHPLMDEMVAKLVRDIRRLQDLQPAVKPIRIGCRCWAGRHRSVAVTTLLSDVLEEMDMYGLSPVVAYIHLGAEQRPQCGCPVDCVNLKPDSTKWKQILAEHPAWDPESLKLFWEANGEAAIQVFHRKWATAIKREADILYI